MKNGRTLYIKNPIAHSLAEELSRRMGTTLSDAVIHALEQQIRKTPQPISRERIGELCSKINALPVLDTRSPDEILGYDEFGIPR